MERTCAAGLLTRVGKGWYVVTRDEGQSSGPGQSERAVPATGLNQAARGRLQARERSHATILCGASAAAVWGYRSRLEWM